MRQSCIRAERVDHYSVRRTAGRQSDREAYLKGLEEGFEWHEGSVAQKFLVGISSELLVS
jgi:hypothetical protein